MAISMILARFASLLLLCQAGAVVIDLGNSPAGHPAQRDASSAYSSSLTYAGLTSTPVACACASASATTTTTTTSTSSAPNCSSSSSSSSDSTSATATSASSAPSSSPSSSSSSDSTSATATSASTSTTATSASSAPSSSPSSAIPPNSITICLNSGCSNCTTAITSTADNIGTYPNCVGHDTSLLAGRGYASPIGGQGVNAFFNMPQPPVGCAWLVLRPAAMNSVRCGLPNLYVEQAGCYFSNLQSRFNLQTCCGNQCTLAFPPGARRRRRRSLEPEILIPSIEAPPGELHVALAPPTIIPATQKVPADAQIAISPERQPVSSSLHLNDSSHSFASASDSSVSFLSTSSVPSTTSLPTTSTTSDSSASSPPIATTPPTPPSEREHARRWHWPWDPQSVAMPTPSAVMPPGMPTGIPGMPNASPSPTAVQLECSGKVLLASPAVKTEGAQIRIGSDIDCGASNAACAQTDSITVHRGYNVLAQTITGGSVQISAIAESLTASFNLLLGFQLDFSTDTSLASSLTIPPGSRGVLTWTPYYRCGVVSATGCNQGIGNTNLTACSPILDGSKRAIGEYTIVTVG